MRRRVVFMIISAIVLFVIVILAANIYLDLLWFTELGMAGVFWTGNLARWGLRWTAWLFLFVFLFINLLFTRRHLLRFPNLNLREQLANSGILRLLTPRKLTIFFLVFSAVFSFVFSAYSGGYWMELLRYHHATQFNIADPIFGKDAAFFVFQLPFLRFIYGYLMMTLITTLVITGALYFLLNAPARGAGHWMNLPFTGLSHLTLLLGAIFALKAWDYRLQQLELVLSEGGVVFGAGYTDLHANLPVLRLLMVLAAVIALIFLANAVLRRFKIILYGFLTLIGVSLLGGWAYPAIIQGFVVEPSEFTYEKEFIEHNIRFTRAAYGLDQFGTRAYAADKALNWQDLSENPGTLNNVRLWDYRPLINTLNQLQALRLYYRFTDVDIGRYTVDGEYRQVMLAAREMDKSRFPPEAQTWVNMRLQYTHGYGVTVSPVNEVSPEGLPHYFVKDIPPVTSAGLELTEPSIYYGELTDDYVIVNTRTREFHYATAGDENVFVNYEGEGGIQMGSFWRRLLFALKFGDYRILISDELTGDSRIMFNRDIATRATKLAPFLLYDRDPYIVIHDGRLFWIQDAYTVTNRFPYSTPYGGLNYIRNSVKVVIDAYHGKVDFYLADPDDPLAETFNKIFPGLFRPLEEMPAGLVNQLRYPQDIFNVQAQALTLYHTTDPNIVYSREDLWDIPVELYGGREQPMEPYYTILQLPGYQEPEFVLILPFTPARRDNMIAWMVARSDGAHYGQVELFLFPRDRVVMGPRQIENRIDQDTEISEQLTLWDQLGSQVIRGNLLVLPVSGGLLYVKPIFLEAAGGGLPELARVVVVYGETVVMERSLEQALVRIFGMPEEMPPWLDDVELPDPEQPLPTEPQPAEPQPAPPAPPVGDATLAGLIQRAQSVYDEAMQRQRQGDWAGYGEKISELEGILNELARIAP